MVLIQNQNYSSSMPGWTDGIDPEFLVSNIKMAIAYSFVVRFWKKLKGAQLHT